MLRIKEVIKEKGLTVKEVANKLGMSSPSLSDAINGNPTVEKVERIAEAIGVPVAELFERPSTDVIICPKCGAELEIKMKE
ncbi:MAG: helix-turn-helix domain-containing protein [Prevotellaceae bacterium]|jgi:transcriptional regulator with XRE-family HTH domain|nr:helix-turn-helix domain-containing protein [Prevotellaceae bacterium]